LRRECSNRNSKYGPDKALEFDSDGVATVTIGSLGSGADLETCVFACDPASVLNQIFVPEETTTLAVETGGEIKYEVDSLDLDVDSTELEVSEEVNVENITATYEYSEYTENIDVFAGAVVNTIESDDEDVLEADDWDDITAVETGTANLTVTLDEGVLPSDAGVPVENTVKIKVTESDSG